jgi:uncharacterized membrane protein YphA (DoxX/SURF4 family)
MSLSTLLLRIGIAALIFMAIIAFTKKEDKNWLMLFLQSFCGILFLFSGWVKAVDPLGTAYKMEQYFTEFELTFADTALSGIAPLFPWLSSLSIGFSVFMIVFEIVLGLMLLTGTLPKLTSWLFFLLVAFFTVLTGFTYLTGYVPSGGNFFAFAEWGAYTESNMRVTDCGCFGDFIKLKPRISFFKDIFLLFPSIYFLLKHKSMVQLFTKPVRMGIMGLGTAALLLYCFSNYVWDLPHTDFRPFKVGADVAAVKEKEMEAAANVDIYAYLLKDRATGEEIEVPYDQYIAGFSTTYSKDKYEAVDQLKTKPTMEMTKVSEFDVTDAKGNDVSYYYLDNEKKHYMIVAHKLKYEAVSQQVMVSDTTYSVDTLTAGSSIAAMLNNQRYTMVSDTLVAVEGEDVLVIRYYEVTQRETQYTYTFDADYVAKYKEVIAPLVSQAKSKGYEVSLVSGSDFKVMKALLAETGISMPTYTADDILLKTIVRSNPGIVLWQDGKILNKWHESKFDGVE